MKWREVAVLDVLSDVTGGNEKTKLSDYAEHGEHPIVDQGQSLIGGYTDDPDRLCKTPGPLIIFGDHTKAVKYIDFPFCLGADGTKVLKPKEGTDPKYLFYALHNVQIPEAGYSRHFKYLKAGKIPLPPLDEQRRIAGILDQADALRRLRGRALDKLNTLGQAIFHEMFDRSDFPSASLKQLGVVQTGATPSTKDDNNFNGEIPFLTPGDLEDTAIPRRFLSVSGAKKSRQVPAGSLLVCCIGSVGKMGIAQRESAFNQQMNSVTWGKDILPNFGYFAVLNKKEEIIHWASRAATTLPILKKSEFEKLAIFVPPLTEQQKFEDRISQLSGIRTHFLEAETRAHAIFTSLQHRAFRGEL